MDLIWKFHKLFFKKLKRRTDLPFHPKRFPFLLAVVKHPGISQKEIAKLLNIEPPTVAITLKRMEKDGLIFRKVSDKDRRVLEVYPTEAAISVYNDMRKAVTELESEMLSILPEEKISCVEEVFEKLNEWLSRCEDQ